MSETPQMSQLVGDVMESALNMPRLVCYLLIALDDPGPEADFAFQAAQAHASWMSPDQFATLLEMQAAAIRAGALPPQDSPAEAQANMTQIAAYMDKF